MQSRMPKLLSIEQIALLDFMEMHCQEVQRAVSMDARSLRLTGIPMHAC